MLNSSEIHSFNHLFIQPNWDGHSDEQEPARYLPSQSTRFLRRETLNEQSHKITYNYDQSQEGEVDVMMRLAGGQGRLPVAAVIPRPRAGDSRAALSRGPESPQPAAHPALPALLWVHRESRTTGLPSWEPRHELRPFPASWRDPHHLAS